WVARQSRGDIGVAVPAQPTNVVVVEIAPFALSSPEANHGIVAGRILTTRVAARNCPTIAPRGNNAEFIPGSALALRASLELKGLPSLPSVEAGAPVRMSSPGHGVLIVDLEVCIGNTAVEVSCGQLAERRKMRGAVDSIPCLARA